MKISTRSRYLTHWLLTIGLVASGCALTGCANKAQTGAGIGALSGGLIGSLVGPSKNKEQNALIGAAAGGLLGYAIGNEMDKEDRARVNNALETSQSYQTTQWVNPDNGRRYVVTPKPVRRIEGRDCRDAEIEIFINGEKETATRTACRGADGQWEM